MDQLDLFAVKADPIDFNGSEADRLGWERRALSDMEQGPLVCCYPGFMGAVCERLVAKGLATKEPAGFLPPPDLPPASLKKMGRRAEDYPRFRYASQSPGTTPSTQQPEEGR